MMTRGAREVVQVVGVGAVAEVEHMAEDGHDQDQDHPHHEGIPIEMDIILTGMSAEAEILNAKDHTVPHDVMGHIVPRLIEGMAQDREVDKADWVRSRVVEQEGVVEVIMEVVAEGGIKIPMLLQSRCTLNLVLWDLS